LNAVIYVKGPAVLLKRLASGAAATVLAGCVVGLESAAASAAPTLRGEGSTLVAPLEAEWAAAFDSATGDVVTYNPDGSGAGYKGVANRLDDFGASDAPLSAYSTPPCNSCIQIPWALSATGVSYNIPGLRLRRGHALHLSPSVLAGIYLGQITSWSDSRITRLNRGVGGLSGRITPIWRNDASGDSFAFSAELSDVSGSFRGSVGPSTQPSFRTGVGAKGNSGMAATLASTRGGIAYISVAYLLANRLPAAGIQNNRGNFAVPNLNAIEAAAAVFHSVPGNNQLTIVNPNRRAKLAYPISTYTYVMVPRNAPQGGLLQSFIGFALSKQGQSFGPRLGFAPLPRAVLNRDRATVGQIQ
jgi:phosphate transport system substrate-binding protein